MSQDLATMTRRVATLRGKVAASRTSSAFAAEIEDLLAAGYACALSGDAWSAQAERRLHALLEDPHAPLREDKVRELARQHAEVQRDLITLRRELSELRHAGRAGARGQGHPSGGWGGQRVDEARPYR